MRSSSNEGHLGFQPWDGSSNLPGRSNLPLFPVQFPVAVRTENNALLDLGLNALNRPIFNPAREHPFLIFIRMMEIQTRDVVLTTFNARLSDLVAYNEFAHDFSARTVALIVGRAVVPIMALLRRQLISFVLVRHGS